MKQFLVLFRESDARTQTHNPEELRQHRQNWNSWQARMAAGKKLTAGNALTLNGSTIKGKDRQLSPGPYMIGQEFVGGWLLLNAETLEEAAADTRECPIFEFDGFAEIREIADFPTPPSRQELNKEIVRRFNIAFIQNGDPEAFREIISPRFINHTAPPGTSDGPDGVLYFINEVFKKAFSRLTVTLHDQFAEGDTVITRKSFRATHTGEFMGIPATGRTITHSIIDIIRLQDGQYTDHWSIRDLHGLLTQLQNPK